MANIRAIKYLRFRFGFNKDEKKEVDNTRMEITINI